METALKSDQCGIETSEAGFSHLKTKWLKSDQCGIETQLKHVARERNFRAQIGPMWD